MTPTTEIHGNVLIVGAGIGGLTTAIALRRAGIDVTVLERAPELREVGAGISLWPNAINSLRRLGVGDAVEAAGRSVTETETRSWRGTVHHATPVDQLESRFGAPLVMIHRGALQAVLRSALDDGVVRLDSRCVALQQDNESVRLLLADGCAVTGRVAIGADGLNSAVRAVVLKDGPPRARGIRSWRAVVDVDPSLAAQLATGESWGRGSVFGVQRLPHDQVYWYAAARVGVDDAHAEGSERDEVRRRFDEWHAPIPQLIDATEDDAVLCHDLFDREVPGSLAFGRVALVGDAAHPMLPYLGQGACQAIVDAETVATTLSDAVDPVTALQAYSRLRLPGATQAVVMSSRMSTVAHLRNPVAVGLRRALLRTTSASTALKRLGPIVGGSPTLVDLRVSGAPR